MEQTMFYVEDSVLVQQCMVTVALLGVAVLCLMRLRTGVYATFGAIGGLASGLAWGVGAVAWLEVRANETQRVWDTLYDSSLALDVIAWAQTGGIVVVAFAVVADRAST